MRKERALVSSAPTSAGISGFGTDFTRAVTDVWIADHETLCACLRQWKIKHNQTFTFEDLFTSL